MTDQTTGAGTNNNVDKWFWVIGIAGLLWNLVGFGSFIMSLNLNEETLALMSEAQRADYENTPMWLMAIYGIATIVGTLGCIALLIKKKWAVLLFLISFIAIIIQMLFGIINSTAELGASSFIVPILVIGVGGLLWYYAKKSEDRGWLN